MEDVFCQLLANQHQLMANQTRMVEATLGQMGAVLGGVAGLLQVGHQVGVIHPAPPQVVMTPSPPPIPAPAEPDDQEDDGGSEVETGDQVEVAPPSMLPEALRLIIERAVDKLVPLIFEKLTSGEGIGGIPFGALLDWRKARPDAAATTAGMSAAASTPAPPIASVPTPPPAAPTSTVHPSHAAASAAAHVAPSSAPSGYAMHDVPVSSSPPATASAGAAPSPTSPLGAAPAEAASTASASSLAPQAVTHEDAAAMLNAHILQIWQGLSPPERNRASELISGLSDAQRTAWFAELARLTVPEAIARARAVLSAQPRPTSPNPPLLTATPEGDPSS
jgi:hypothetical protein